MALSEDEKDRLNGIREQLERHILTTFNGKEMWYQESTLQVKGIAHITTDEWGVHVNFESENPEAISLASQVFSSRIVQINLRLLLARL